MYNLNSKTAVYESLAYAKYDYYMNSNHRHNFLRFILDCLENEYRECQLFAEHEYSDFISMLEAKSYVLDELYTENRTIKDFMCQMYSERSYPNLCIPLIFSFNDTASC